MKAIIIILAVIAFLLFVGFRMAQYAHYYENMVDEWVRKKLSNK